MRDAASPSVTYMDYAATTPLRPVALAAMMPFLTSQFGNPSAAHSLGRAARRAVDDARDHLAQCLGCASSEVIFTSGGTEANNLAMKGLANAPDARGRHILVSAVEHPSVRNVARYLAGQGWQVEEIPVNGCCQVDPQSVAQLIRSETALVAVMHANNEIGAIQPLAEIAGVCRDRGVPLFVDAVQSIGHIPFNFREIGAGACSLSAHKFGGPKGVGVLCVSSPRKLRPLLQGGGQERERRAGTENVAGIVGMAAALQEAVTDLPAASACLRALGQTLQAGLCRLGQVHISGRPEERLPGLVHACFAGIDAQTLLIHLDRHNIAASAGASCSSGAGKASHVLEAMGLAENLAKGALRFSMGFGSQNGDVDRLLTVLPPVVQRMRSE